MRFPEFTEPWERRKLSEFATKITKKNRDNTISNVLSNSATLGIVQQSQYFEREIVTDENLNGYYVINKDDFVYNPRKSVSAPCGPVNKYDGKESGIISPLYLCFTVNNINRSFLLWFFKSPKWYRYIYLNGDSGVRHDRVSIKDDLFLDMPITIPLSAEQEKIMPITIPLSAEQEKISKLFELIDRHIAVQSGLIEDLKKIKKHLMEQLFCQPKEKSPRLRLVGMSGEWKRVRLCDVVQRVTTRNKTNECTRVLTIAAQYGLIDQQEFFNKQIASSDLTTYYLLHRGDFAYNKSYSSDYPWGAVKRLDNYDEGVLSSLYICFCPNKNIDSDFLRNYFESTKWYRGISEISGEGARNHGLLNMSVDDYFNTTHRFPSIEEQRCISHLLNAFAHKILNEESILDKLRSQKSYLLNNMFI